MILYIKYNLYVSMVQLNKKTGSLLLLTFLNPIQIWTGIVKIYVENSNPIIIDNSVAIAQNRFAVDFTCCWISVVPVQVASGQLIITVLQICHGSLG